MNIYHNKNKISKRNLNIFNKIYYNNYNLNYSLFNLKFFNFYMSADIDDVCKVGNYLY